VSCSECSPVVCWAGVGVREAAQEGGGGYLPDSGRDALMLTRRRKKIDAEKRSERPPTDYQRQDLEQQESERGRRGRRSSSTKKQGRTGFFSRKKAGEGSVVKSLEGKEDHWLQESLERAKKNELVYGV